MPGTSMKKEPDRRPCRNAQDAVAKQIGKRRFPSWYLLFCLLFSPYPLAAQEQIDAYSEAELDQMLAPIALYPDVLLSQVLMAASYPLEVVQAARWSRQYQLQGEDAVAAAANEDWDPSVKALLAFPRLLTRMDEDLEWTQHLGEAFLFQEDELMARVQLLRQRAYDAGNLHGLEHVRVSRAQDAIIIEPPSPQLVYVPYYNSSLIYGNWWWPSYPPLYWAPPGNYQLGLGFVWGGAVSVSAGFFYSTIHWPQRHIILVPGYRPFYQHPYRSSRDYYAGYGPVHPWRHDPRHRRGVVYRDHGWRTPPPQIGRPVDTRPPAAQRPSILRGTTGQTQQRGTLSSPQRNWSTTPREGGVQAPRTGEQRQSIQRAPSAAAQNPPRRATTTSPGAAQGGTTSQSRSGTGRSSERQSAPPASGGGGQEQRRSILR